MFNPKDHVSFFIRIFVHGRILVVSDRKIILVSYSTSIKV